MKERFRCPEKKDLGRVVLVKRGGGLEWREAILVDIREKKEELSTRNFAFIILLGETPPTIRIVPLEDTKIKD